METSTQSRAAGNTRMKPGLLKPKVPASSQEKKTGNPYGWLPLGPEWAPHHPLPYPQGAQTLLFGEGVDSLGWL